MAVGGDVGAPDAVAPPPGHRRFPLLDGMRAIAVLCIVAVHASGPSPVSSEWLTRLITHLNFGVTIFFLLSGFLLYRPFVAHRAGGPAAAGAGTFYKRRLLRIVPAYWLCLTILLIFSDRLSLSGPNLAAQYSLLQTMPFVGEGNCTEQLAGCPVFHTWSLAVEVTFYAALPLYVLLAERLARGRKMLEWVRLELVLLAALAVASVAYGIAGEAPAPTTIMGGTFIGFFLWFALGMGLALLSVASEGRTVRWVGWIERRPAVPWLAAAALYAGLVALLPITAFVLDRGDRLISNVGFGLAALLLLLPAVFGDDRGGLPRRFLANPVIAWIGLVSYGVFLWHIAVLIRINDEFTDVSYPLMFLLVLGISLAIAAASYYLVERPILRLKTGSLRRPFSKRRLTSG